MGTVNPDTKLEVKIRTPSIRHAVTVKQIQSWLGGRMNTPAETICKKKMMAPPAPRKA